MLVSKLRRSAPHIQHPTHRHPNGIDALQIQGHYLLNIPFVITPYCLHSVSNMLKEMAAFVINFDRV